MDVSVQTNQSALVQNKLAERYHASKDEMDKVMDEILEFHDGDVRKVKEGVFYKETKKLAALKELKVYEEKRKLKDSSLSQLGVDYNWLTTVPPNAIETKFFGAPKCIQDLTRLRKAALATLNTKEKLFDADFDRLLVKYLLLARKRILPLILF